LLFLLFLILDRIFFRPVTAVLKKREELTVGALEHARAIVATAETKTREYEATFQAARQEVYRQREVARRASLAERDAALQKARVQSEGMLHDAQAALAGEVARLKVELETACQSLAEEITQSLVGPESLSGGEGGPRL
jgi:F0F1-type ATP synthase membrane subunit b/b'